MNNFPDTNLNAKTGSRGTFYSLSDYRFGPRGVAEGRYNGCGNGFVVISKELDEVTEMSYADDGHTINVEPNVVLCEDAGAILREDEDVKVIRANFSCWTACLF